ncbi:protein phosphatase 2C [Seiridium cupressi]
MACMGSFRWPCGIAHGSAIDKRVVAFRAGPAEKAFVSLDDALLQGAVAAVRSDAPYHEQVAKLMPAYTGSCALLSLLDPKSWMLRVACVGDSRAVLGQQDAAGKWAATALSVDQTGSNEDEIARIHAEHPGESEITKAGRVLGIMVSRGFGDGRWKWNLDFQAEVKKKFDGFNPLSPEKYAVKTPPYLTAEPVVTTTKLDDARPSFLIMASDGFWDRVSNEQAVTLISGWLASRTTDGQQRENQKNTITSSVSQSQHGPFQIEKHRQREPGFLFTEERTTYMRNNAAVHLMYVVLEFIPPKRYLGAVALKMVVSAAVNLAAAMCGRSGAQLLVGDVAFAMLCWLEDPIPSIRQAVIAYSPTMSAVTEIASLHLKSGVSPATAAQKIESLVIQQPGSLRVRHSTKHEDPEQVVFFIDWEDLSAHEAFMRSDAYGSFLEDVGQLIKTTPAIYHVPLVPFPPTVLNNDGGRGKTAVAEVMHAYFPTDIDMVQQQEVLAQVQQFLDETTSLKPKGYSGETAHGFVLEDLEFKEEKCRALLFIMGWDSVDSHMAYRGTEGFARTIPLVRGLPGMKGMQMWHVTNSEATK